MVGRGRVASSAHGLAEEAESVVGVVVGVDGGAVVVAVVEVQEVVADAGRAVGAVYAGQT